MGSTEPRQDDGGRDRARPSGDVAARANSRLVAFAAFASALATWGTVLALAVHAWQVSGPGAVGVMALSRALASGVGGPLLGRVAGRRSRRSTLLLTNAARGSVVVGMAAAAAADSSLVVIFGLMTVLGLLDPVYEAVQGTMLTEVVVDPTGLASVNALEGIASNGGFLVGSAGAGFLMSVTSTAPTLVVFAVAFALSLVPLALMRHHERRGGGGGVDVDVEADAAAVASAAGVVEILRAAAGTRGLRESIGYLGVLALADGALDVLAVCAALGYLGAGESGAGLLQATVGAGTIIGSAIFLSSRRAHRLVLGVVLGSVVLGLSFVGVATASGLGPATLILGVGGLGYATAEVGSITLVGRRAAGDRLIHILGVVVSIKSAAYAIGAACAGFAADAYGARMAFVGAGGAALAITTLLGLALIRWNKGESAPAPPGPAVLSTPVSGRG